MENPKLNNYDHAGMIVLVLDNSKGFYKSPFATIASLEDLTPLNTTVKVALANMHPNNIDNAVFLKREEYGDNLARWLPAKELIPATKAAQILFGANKCPE